MSFVNNIPSLYGHYKCVHNQKITQLWSDPCGINLKFNIELKVDYLNFQQYCILYKIRRRNQVHSKLITLV